MILIFFSWPKTPLAVEFRDTRYLPFILETPPVFPRKWKITEDAKVTFWSLVRILSETAAVIIDASFGSQF